MMKKAFFKIIFLISLLIASLAQSAPAGAERENPFESQLPEPVEVIEPTPPPIEPIRQTGIQITPNKNISNNVPPPPELTGEELVITGVVWNSNRPQAIINDQVVDVGDKISQYQIVSISKTKIELAYEGQTITVTP